MMSKTSNLAENFSVFSYRTITWLKIQKKGNILMNNYSSEDAY